MDLIIIRAAYDLDAGVWYVESSEPLHGLNLEAETLDAAIEWAARCPGAAHGAIEVRPLWQMTA